MFLPLAERMVEKMVKEDKIEAEAEVKIWILQLDSSLAQQIGASELCILF